MTNKEFIEKIAPICQDAYKVIGKVKPSVAIAMACVECAYGRAGSVKHNSLFGFKVGSGKTATKYWSGKAFSSKTKEEYTIGQHTTITAAFRAYDSWVQCVFNFYELLNTSLYKRVLATSDYQVQMQQIKECGYMTSSTEVSTVLKIIKDNNLTKYDDLVSYPSVVEEKPKTNEMEYVVVAGDTLWGISARYLGGGANWRKLFDYNNLSTTRIIPGQIIKIPKGV